jgi:PKD repeat protein
MNKYFLISMLSIIVLLISSCEKLDDPPVASFSMNKTTAKVGETIAFTNLSTNHQGCLWSFGDGSNSISTNPTYAYSNAGTFTIELKVFKKGESNSNHVWVAATKTIVITQ